MLVLISQLQGRSVVTFDDAQPLGNLAEPIIDPDNGRVLGFFFNSGLFGLRKDVLSTHDIAAYDRERIIVQHDGVFHQTEGEPKLEAVLKKRTPVFHAPVYTESGKRLGVAKDLLFDTEMAMIVKYYVHGMLQDRIIPADRVIAIDKRGIVVQDTATNLVGEAIEA